MALLVAAAVVLPQVASAGDAAPSSESTMSAVAELTMAMGISSPSPVGPDVADPAASSSTTTTVLTPDDVCAELGGPDCVAALAECDALGPNACVQLVQCLGVGIATQSAYFPFDCWPDGLGDPAVYLCRVLVCPGSPPSFCASPDVARIGWCGPDGELVQPSEGTTTTSATTAPTSTSTSTSTTTAPTTSTPSTTTTVPTTSTTAAPTTTTTVPTTSTTSTTSTLPPTSAAPTTTPTSSTLPFAGVCDPNYRGQCVPIADSVDCADLAGFGVEVVGEDIHGLDGDDDGIGCEAPAAQVAGITTSRGSGGPTGSGGSTGSVGSTRSGSADLALTGSTATPLLVAGLLLLAGGLALVSVAATSPPRRPGGYSFTSVDDLGFPTRYRVTGRRAEQRFPRRPAR